MFPLKDMLVIAHEARDRASSAPQNLDDTMHSSLLPISSTIQQSRGGNASPLIGLAAPLVCSGRCHNLQMHDIQALSMENTTAMASCPCCQRHYHRTMSKLLDEALSKTKIMDETYQNAEPTSMTTLSEGSHDNGAGVNPHGNDNHNRGYVV